jgi:hypothetical protein
LTAPCVFNFKVKYKPTPCQTVNEQLEEGPGLRHGERVVFFRRSLQSIDMFTTLALLACIGTGTVGGVFFAFSAFVMKALVQLPASRGVAAMQRIKQGRSRTANRSTPGSATTTTALG